MESLKKSTELELITKHLIYLAKKSTCKRAKCASIIINTSSDPLSTIIGEGFNSMPCNESGECFKDKLSPLFKSDRTCCIHAEQRAIINAISTHPSLVTGSSIYFLRINSEGNPEPAGDPYCSICSKMALDVGIKHFHLYSENDTWIRYETKEYNKLTFEFGK